MNLEQAKAIMDKVRETFAGGGKSGNKAYVAEGSERDPDAAPEFPDNPEGTPIVTKGTPDYSHIARRNHNAEIIGILNDNAREAWSRRKQFNAAVLYGQQCLQNKYGNCLEMACAAAFIANRDGFNDDLIFIVTTDGHGDHVFCLILPMTTKTMGVQWHRLANYPEPYADGIVIDPWANVCCRLSEYQGAFTAMAGSWLGRGKRIFGGGNEWLAPDGNYVNKQFTSSIELRNARNSPPANF